MNYTPVDIIPDISFWQDDNNTVRKVDFAKMRIQTQGVIIRTGQHTWIDEDFTYNWQAAKQAGLRRGSYFYYDSRSTPQSQAQLWKNAIGNDLPELGLWCDLEENYGGVYRGESNYKLFVESVRSLFPNSKIGIYTSYGWWNAQAIAQVDYWASFPLWLAWYTTNVSNVILPFPWRFKSPILWQNTDKGDGLKYGTESLNIDLSYTSKAFYDLFGASTPAPVDVETMPYDGMTRISGTRYGWRFELFITDPSKVNYELVSTPMLETVSSVARRRILTLAVNGGEWDRISRPKDYTVSNGVVIHERVEAVPSLMVTEDNWIFIDHINRNDTQQALSGLRYLIRLGVIQSYLDGIEPQYTEGHARSIHGLRADGFHMVMQSEGVYPNHGLTLKQAAEIMKQYGAVTAFDSGGGGDVTCILNGQSLIVIENIFNGQHIERALPATLLIYEKDIPMTTRYEATAKGDNTKLRPNHNTVTDFNPIQSFIAGTKFYGDVLWVADATNKDSSQYVGDKWLQTDPAHWVAIIHRGVEICTLIDHGEAPPPTPADWIETTTQELAPGSIVTTLWHSGKVDKYIVP